MLFLIGFFFNVGNIINFVKFRCKSFQSVKRGEICRIPGCSVSPSAPGTPTPVRLPQFQGETFKQFINYVYTGKVCIIILINRNSL